MGIKKNLRLSPYPDHLLIPLLTHKIAPLPRCGSL
jgi:hypothetical protein